KLLQRSEGYLKTVDRAPVCRGPPDAPLAHGLLAQRGAKRVAIAREAILNLLDTRICQNRKRGGMRQVASIGAQKFRDFLALVVHVLVPGVYRIDHHDDLDGNFVATHCAERRDGSW